MNDKFPIIQIKVIKLDKCQNLKLKVKEATLIN